MTAHYNGRCASRRSIGKVIDALRDLLRNGKGSADIAREQGFYQGTTENVWTTAMFPMQATQSVRVP